MTPRVRRLVLAFDVVALFATAAVAMWLRTAWTIACALVAALNAGALAGSFLEMRISARVLDVLEQRVRAQADLIASGDRLIKAQAQELLRRAGLAADDAVHPRKGIPPPN